MHCQIELFVPIVLVCTVVVCFLPSFSFLPCTYDVALLSPRRQHEGSQFVGIMIVEMIERILRTTHVS